MSSTKSSSSSSSSYSSSSNTPETPKKLLDTSKKTPISSPDTAKAPKSPSSFPDMPDNDISSPESSNVPKSPLSSPETPKVPTPKVSKSPSSSPEPSKVPKSPLSSPEISKVPKSPLSSPETSKVPKSPSSPETSKVPKSPSSPETSKVPESSSSSPEISKVPKSPLSSPESSKVSKSPSSSETSKVPKSPSSSETSKVPKSPSSSETSKIPKSPLSSPESSKVPKSPSSSETSKVPKSPLSSPEPSKVTATKVSKTPISSPESSKVPKSPISSPESFKVPRSPVSSPENFKFAKLSTRFKEVPNSPKPPSEPSDIPKKVLRHDFLHKVSSPESPKEDPKSPSPSELRGSPKKLPANKIFTSSLQVFLMQKQDTELVKSKEYKEKVEMDKTTEESVADKEGGDDGGIDTENNEVKEEEVNEKVVDTKNLPDIESIKKNIKYPILPKFKEREETRAEEKRKNEEEEEKKMEIDKEVNQGEQKSEKCEEIVKDEKKDEENKDKTADEKKVKTTEMEEEKNEQVTKEKRGKSEEIVTEKRNEEREQEKKAQKTADDGKEKEKVKEEKREERAKEKTNEIIKEEKYDEKKEIKGKETKKETKREKEEKKRSIRKEEDIKDEKAQGLLYLKRKSPFNRWKEYFFVLDGMLLSYYRSQHNYEHLASMKGSFDLSVVADVTPKKPGIMRTHHPFSLSRRNLPSIVLAAETKEEQERWIQVLLMVVGHRRQSFHTLEKTVKDISISPKTKYSTLPTRIKETEVGSCSSSITEEEEEEQEEEENDELVKPKKITGVPIGMPLVKVDLNQLKLKKVERRDEERENVEKGKTTDSPSNSTREGEKQDSEEGEERPPGKVFGVMLKRTKTKEELEEKEAARERSPFDGSSSPKLSTSSSGSIKRSLKQPVIPLNSSKLLVVPKGKEGGHSSPRVSPTTQKRASSEKRKSPSPSLPISKSVQALTKSAEEVKSTQANVTTQEDVKTSSDSANNIEEKKLDAEVKVCHAQTSEVNYSDVVDILLVEEVTENVVKVEESKEETQEEGGRGEIQNKMRETIRTEKEAMKENEEEKDKDEEKVEVKGLLETSVEVEDKEEKKDIEDKDEENKEMVGSLKKETSDDRVNSKNNDDIQQPQDSTFIRKHNHLGSKEDNIEGCVVIPESSCVTPPTTPITPPASPASSVASSESKSLNKSSISLSRSESVPSSPKIGSLVLEKTPSPSFTDSKRHHSATLPEKPESHKEQEQGDVILRKSPRDQTNTNESASSSLSEGGDRKSSKFKLLKNKLKVGGSIQEKKPDSGVQKEPKEKKRKGSNAFSVLLHGKKAKEVNLKPPEEESQTSQQDESNRYEVIPSIECPNTQMEVSPEHVLPAVDVHFTAPPIHLPCEEEPEYPLHPTLTTPGGEDNRNVTIRTTTTTTNNESRYSSYSYTSNCSREDPPPSIPEKTHRRASSPNHDVPKNNRPVTNVHLLFPEYNGEEEDENKRVDGYISEKQIEELLIAKENREKRKRSLSRGQLFAKPDIVKGTLSVSMPEEWTKRPSYTSFSSIESDEPLTTTNFLSFEQQSSSSGSIKAVNRAGESERSSFYSEDGESVNQEVEGIPESVPVRRALRPTDAIAANNRVSLTSPEFTVMEEEAHNSPETPKATIPPNISVDEKDTGKVSQTDDEDE